MSETQPLTGIVYVAQTREHIGGRAPYAGLEFDVAFGGGPAPAAVARVRRAHCIATPVRLQHAPLGTPPRVAPT